MSNSKTDDQHAYVEEQFHEDEIDLKHFFFVLMKYKWSILALSMTVSVLTSIWSYSLTPVYRATASILIEAEEAKVISIEDVYGLQNSNWEYYETQLHILKSRALAEKVFETLGLGKKINQNSEQTQKEEPSTISQIKNTIKSFIPDYLGKNKPVPVLDKETLKNMQVNGLMAGLDIKLLEDSQIITISYDSTTPELAAKIPNELASAYINSFLEADLEKTQQATGWITKRTSELREKFEDSEKELQAFIEKEKLIDLGGVNSLASKELGTLTNSLVEAKQKRSENEALYKQVKLIQAENSIDKLESLPSVLNHPLISSAYSALSQSKRKVSELSKRYGPKHPKMISALTELETSKSELKKQIGNIAKSVSKEFEIAKAEESHLLSEMNKAKNQVRDTNKKSYQLAALQREVETNRELYEVFLTRFKETAATSDLQPVNASIVDTAVVPQSPYKPNKKSLITRAFILSLLFGFGVALLIEYLDNTFKDSHDLEERLKLPVLGVLPKLKSWGINRNAMHLFIKDYKSGFAESIRTIRTGIMLSNIDVDNKIIVVTSSVPGEGKSLVSSNLAAAIAQMKKTILIDADMRKPVVGKSYKLKESAKGLSDLVAMSAEFSDCIHPSETKYLDILPAGAPPPNPLELLSSVRFKSVIAELKKHYDYIVIDSAPVIAVSDPRVLARIADGVVFVVKADETTYQLARKGLRKLSESNSHIIGTVLNQVTATKKSKYSEYDSNYYSYYGYS